MIKYDDLMKDMNAVVANEFADVVRRKMALVDDPRRKFIVAFAGLNQAAAMAAGAFDAAYGKPKGEAHPCDTAIALLEIVRDSHGERSGD